jgi:hypothetical protein
MRKELIMLNQKIADHHLIRKACIYIRQSTMAQVRFNQESTERQYNLADQAKSLGWMPEQIRILDGDLAQSGELTTKRDDFKTLVSDVAMGQVGAIFSLETVRCHQDIGIRRRWLLQAEQAGGPSLLPLRARSLPSIALAEREFDATNVIEPIEKIDITRTNRQTRSTKRAFEKPKAFDSAVC